MIFRTFWWQRSDGFVDVFIPGIQPVLPLLTEKVLTFRCPKHNSSKRGIYALRRALELASTIFWHHTQSMCSTSSFGRDAIFWTVYLRERENQLLKIGMHLCRLNTRQLWGCVPELVTVQFLRSRNHLLQRTSSVSIVLVFIVAQWSRTTVSMLQNGQ